MHIKLKKFSLVVAKFAYTSSEILVYTQTDPINNINVLGHVRMQHALATTLLEISGVSLERYGTPKQTSAFVTMIFPLITYIPGARKL